MTFGMHPPQSVYIRINGDLGKETRKKSAKQLLKRKSRRRESCQTLKVLSWASEEGRLQREVNPFDTEKTLLWSQDMQRAGSEHLIATQLLPGGPAGMPAGKHIFPPMLVVV